MEKEKKPVYKKWWFWVIIVIVIIAIAGGDSNNSSTTDNSKTTLTSVDAETINSDIKNIKSEKAKVTVIDFSQMTSEEIKNWCNTNNVLYNEREDYSDTIEKGAFISQSVVENETIYEGEKIVITYSLGKEPTMGEKNALKSAYQYLNYTAFSYTRLIEQLEYEGYSKEEATYGVDNCGADWNEQATKMAKQYIGYTSFSRSGLIEQLEYEGFTKEQAEYGANSVGY